MKFWLASADPAAVVSARALGLFSHIVTNPDALASTGRSTREVFRDLCHVSPGRVYAMVREGPLDAMQAEADALLAIDSQRIGLKLALTPNGLRLADWLNGRQATADLMMTCVANLADLAIAIGMKARWITPWGSLPQKFGGASREAVLAELQAVVAPLQGKTDLIVGVSSSEALSQQVRLGIRHFFIWDKDIPAVIDSVWVQRALTTFAPAYRRIDQVADAGPPPPSNGY